MTERTLQVEELFQAALERDAGERAAFLVSACSSDDILRAEVESLISAHEKSGDFLTSPLRQRAADMGEAEHPESLVGCAIGYYRVEALIGRGGMGDVYSAIDQRLGRKVALKLLPPRFTGDEKRLRRFELEARTASSLNHPNIVTIHEIGHLEAVHFIATEFVDGQTLRSRLAEGRLGAKEAVELTIGVTSALAAAHVAGIVHRDIKPENVMIRPDGYVKVLDFGLAKLVAQPDLLIDSEVTTAPRWDTDPGTIMGTPYYMSPEQTRGLDIDGRSDVFNTGVVLFEMITGHLPFKGKTTTDVFASILMTEAPQLSDFAPDVPPELQRVVSKALCKDKEERYQRVEDFLADLKAIRKRLESQSSREESPKNAWHSAKPLALAVAAPAIVVLAIIALLGGKPRAGGGEGDVFSSLRFSEIHSWKSERGEGTINARFSHDGRMIAFTMLKGAFHGIWVKQVSMAAEPRLITAEDSNNRWPVWSPDDQRLAFVSSRGRETGIWISASFGGPATLIHPLEDRVARTKSWSRDSKTIYYEAGNNLFALDIATRTVRPLLTHLDPRSPYRHFSLSPTEDRLCYVEVHNGQSDIWVSPLEGGGESIRVTNDVEDDRYPLWHPDGKRIIYTSNRGGIYQICIASLDGAKPRQVTVGNSGHLVSDVSEDGTRLLDVGSRNDADIYAVDVQSGRESELSSGSGMELWPEVSPDNQTIAYQSTDAIGKLLSSTITVRPSSTDGPLIRLASDGFSPSWAPDGSKLAFLRYANSKVDIVTLSLPRGEEKQLTSDGVLIKTHYLLPTTRSGRNVSWSPDSSRIAYGSERSGAPNIWETRVDGSGQMQLTSNTDSNLLLYEPTWSPDGKSIAYATEPYRAIAGSSKTWSLWIVDKNPPRVVHTTQSLLRPCGWSANGTEVIAASGEEPNAFPGSPMKSPGSPMKVSLIHISRAGDRLNLGTLESTYLWTVEVGPDGRTIAFVSNRNNSDNIWLSDATGTGARMITSNSDPKRYFSTIAWAPNGKSIYFAKQASTGLITLIDNFE